MKKNYSVIRCPHCGTEYLPAEIYSPSYFIGKPSNIAKHNGRIISFYGDTMDLKETYLCDTCDTKFTVRASVLFNTSIEDEMETDYHVSLSKAQFVMDEE